MKTMNKSMTYLFAAFMSALSVSCLSGNGEKQENAKEVNPDSIECFDLEKAMLDSTTNDYDENLNGYIYTYQKETEFEDGRFDNAPDYIAIPAKLRGRPEKILMRKGYAVSYNSETKLCNWVAWHLTKQHTYGDEQRPQRAFEDDPDTYNSTHFYDYNKHTDYDRGHMCPAGDNKWDKEAMKQSFLMSNICPQYCSLNSGVWNDIEMKCRDWAQMYGDVYIVCGPVFYENRNGKRKQIGRSRIPVPDAFFKVVLCNHGKGRGIGFLCENRHCHLDLNDYAVSIDDIEKITGMDFFPALPDEMESNVESVVGVFD